MNIHVSELKARVVSEDDRMSTATVMTECQRMCKGVQHDRSADESNTDPISGPPECSDWHVINGLAEPHLLRAETNRASPRKERKGKLAVTSPLHVQI
ncbi:hypothetical protein CLCR_02687 [Cladophialophora carrionii]|uniref:Uncharacterized protein n=1 Tax=Cladophialophora carrionii TaxID=86049 RepID=A0A1C1CF43_9EURO|nr:hypothetical protein CLCR_02687 [Cladophialophora carrionii]